MPARNVIRPTLANRFSNTPASNPATITQSNSINNNIASPVAIAPNAPVAASRSPEGFQGTGEISTVQIPHTQNVSFTAPNGSTGIIQISPNGKASITKNITFTQPIKENNENLGMGTYDYSLKGNEIIANLVGFKGNTFTQPIKENNENLGMGTYDYSLKGNEIIANLIGFKGNTFTQPINKTTNTAIGTLTEKGDMAYKYNLQNSELIPTIVSTSGGVFYQSAYMKNQYTYASNAYQNAKSSVALSKQIRDYEIPSLMNQSDIAYSHNEDAYGYDLFENAVSYAKEANNLMFQPVTKTGALAGYTAIGVIPVAANLMNINKPEEVAKLTTSGLTPLSVKVGDAIYGDVDGKDQHLGTILLSPKVSANTLSLSYAGFKSSIVTISGLGWSAGIYSSFNPSTGKITLNPKNAAWVSAGLRVQSLPNGEVIKSVIMPSGFGIGGNYNYISVSNIPVSNGKWSGLESYTSLDGSSSYSLESAGSFPSAIHSISTLNYGIKSVSLSKREFNPSTGSISYSNSNSFNIPSLGLIAVPTTHNISETYTYQNKAYTFTYSPKTKDYSIYSPNTITTTSINPSTPLTNNNSQFNVVSSNWKAPEVWDPTNSISYIFNSNGNVSGYQITNPEGQFVSGADYLTPKQVVSGNVNSPTITGNSLVLPTSDYLQYISLLPANSKATTVKNALNNQYSKYTNSTSTINNALIKFDFPLAVGAYIGEHAAWDEIQGGELTSQGYTIQGLEDFGKGLAEGEAPVLAIGAPVAAATGAAISGTSQVATNALTNKSLTYNIIPAVSLGADFGGVFGATLPESMDAADIAKTVGWNAVKIGTVFGGYNAIISVGVAAFGGEASTTSGISNSTKGQTSQSQSTGVKSQSSFSLLGNYTASEYLNVGIKSFAQGFTEGTEFAGAFGAVGEVLGTSTSPVAKTILNLLNNKPLVSTSIGGVSFGTTLASGGTLRQAVVAGATSGAFTYGLMGLGSAFSSLNNKISDVTVTSVTGINQNTDLTDLNLNDLDTTTTNTNPSTTVTTTQYDKGVGLFKNTYTAVTTTIDHSVQTDDIGITLSKTVTTDLYKGGIDSLTDLSKPIATFTGDNSGSYVLSQMTDKGLGLVEAAPKLSETGPLSSVTDLGKSILSTSTDITTDLSVADDNTQPFRFVSGSTTLNVFRNLNIETVPDISNLDALNEAAKPEITADWVSDLTPSEDNLGTAMSNLDALNEAAKSDITIEGNFDLANTYGEGKLGTAIIDNKEVGIATGVAYTKGISGPIRFTALSYDIGLDTPFSTDGYNSFTDIINNPISTLSSAKLPNVITPIGLTGQGQLLGLTYTTHLMLPFTASHLMLPSVPIPLMLAKSPLPAGLTYINPNYFGTASSGIIKPYPSKGGKSSVINGGESLVDMGNGQFQVQKFATATKEEQKEIEKTKTKTVTTSKTETLIKPKKKQFQKDKEESIEPFFFYKVPTTKGTSTKTRTKTSDQSLLSIAGIDPYAIPLSPSLSTLVSGTSNLQTQKSITNINLQSNLNPFENLLGQNTTSRTNLLYGSQSIVRNKNSDLQSNKFYSSFKNMSTQTQRLTQTQTQKQSQKQTQKQTQQQGYMRPPPTITPPDLIPKLFGGIAPDNRIKPPKKQSKPHPQQQPTTYKYINDLTSAMFNIHGAKKNKVYNKLGFFRPL